MDLPSLPIDSVVSEYKDAMDWLHRATARNVVVHVSPLESGCPNCLGVDRETKEAFNIYQTTNPFATGTVTVIPSLSISGVLNQSFVSGQTCPVCNGHGALYSPASGNVSARIQWRTADNTFDFRGTKLIVEEKADVRLKVTGGAAELDLMDRAEIIEVDGFKCKITKGHVPVGLRDIHTWYYYANKAI